MKKRVLAFLLAVIMIVSVFAATAFAADPADVYLTNDTIAEISLAGILNDKLSIPVTSSIRISGGEYSNNELSLLGGDVTLVNDTEYTVEKKAFMSSWSAAGSFVFHKAAITANDNPSIEYFYKSGKAAPSAETVFAAIVASTTPEKLSAADVTINYNNGSGWVELNSTSTNGGRHVFGNSGVTDASGNMTEQVSLSLPDGNLWEGTLKLIDPRAVTDIVPAGASVAVDLGVDYATEIAKQLKVVVGETEIIGATISVELDGEVTAAGEITVKASYAGDDNNRPVKEKEISVTINDKPHYNIVKNETSGGSFTVEPNKSLVVYEGTAPGFIVTAKPTNSGTSNNYYTASIVVENDEGTVIASSGTEVDKLTVADGAIQNGDTLTITVTFAKAGLELQDGDVESDWTQDNLKQRIFDAVVKSITPEIKTVDDVTIKYNAKNSGTSYQELSYATKTNYHAFRSNVGDKETVQVSYTYNGRTYTKTATVTIIAPRSETEIVPASTPIQLNQGTDYIEGIRNALTVRVKDGADISGANQSLTITGLDEHKIGQEQTVTVSYAGDKTQYRPSEAEISVKIVPADHYTVNLVTVGNGTVTGNDKVASSQPWDVALGNNFTIKATPSKNYYFRSIVVTDASGTVVASLKWDDDAVTSIKAGEENSFSFGSGFAKDGIYTANVTFEKTDMDLPGEGTIDWKWTNDTLPGLIYDAVFDKDTPKDVYPDNITNFYYLANKSNALSGWEELTFTPSTLQFAHHAFSNEDGDKETVRLKYTYKGAEITKRAVVKIADTRTSPAPAFNELAQLNYYKYFDVPNKTVLDTVTKEDLEQAVLDAILNSDEAQAPDLREEYTNGKVTVEYHAGLTDLTWAELDNEVSFIESATQHNFGEKGINSSETIRVIFAGNDTYKPGEWKVDLSMADLRIPTKIVVSYSGLETLLANLGLTGQKIVPVVYGKDLEEQLLPRLTVMPKTGGAAVEFTAEQISVAPETVSASLFKPQTVTVKYAGDNEYAACELPVTVYVNQANADLKVKTEVVTYDGKQHKPTITAMPEDLDYFSVIAGIDGDATGFVSFDFPKSTKDAMMIQLTPDKDGLIGGIFDSIINGILDRIGYDKVEEQINTLADNLGLKVELKIQDNVLYLDLYQTIANMIGEGIKLGDFEGLVNKINGLLENELINAAIENSGFNINSFRQALDILKGIDNLTVNAMITLGNGPINAGIYSVSALSTDINYRINYATGLLTILPSTENLSIEWKESLPNDHTLTYDEAQEFDFGATIKLKGVAQENYKYARTYFSDWNLGNLLPDIGNTEPDRSVGAHYETVFILGGNEWTRGISRMYIITKNITKININAESLTATYDGNPHGVIATANKDELTEKLTYRYVSATDDYDSSQPPTDAGTYYVFVNFAGDNTNAGATKYVKMVINKADLTLGDPAIEGWTYGADGNTPTVNITSEAAPNAADLPKTTDVVFEYYKAVYDEAGTPGWKIDGEKLDGQPTEAGDYIVKAVVAETNNYVGCESEAHFIIAPKQLALTGENSRMSAGAIVDEKLIRTIFGLDGVLEGDVAAIDLDRVTFSLLNNTGKAYKEGMTLKEFAYTLSTIPGGEYKIIMTTSAANALIGAENDIRNYVLDEGARQDVTMTIYRDTKNDSKTYKIVCGEGVTADRVSATVDTKVTLTVCSGSATPVVTDSKGNSIPVKTVGDKYTFIMPNDNVNVSVDDTGIVDDNSCPYGSACPLTKYQDVSVDSWYHDGVHFCLEKGILQGVAADKFDPSGTLSRAMIVTMLWRLEGEPVADYAMSFDDVANEQWYTEAVRWAQANKIVEGYSDTAFGPNYDVTREQLAAILMRYASFKGVDVSERAALDMFTDVNIISEWALDSVKWANAVGIINGRTETTIVPDGNATRAEAACMMQRFCENF